MVAKAKKPTRQTPRSSAKKSTAKKVVSPRKAAVASTKVDYYPNRMTVAVSALAGTLLVLLALIAVLGSQ